MMETFKRDFSNRIWIRGNDADPRQVIAVLEARGGRNTAGLHGRCATIAYYIADDGVIGCVPLDSMPGVWLQEAWGELHLKGIACTDCIQCKLPACEMGISCCQCDVEDCNSRQPCPQKMEVAL